MNLFETANLLGLMQTYDQRTVGQSDVMSWQALLIDVALDDARQAVFAHYSESTDRIMPAHVLRRVADMNAERNRPKPRWAPGQAGVPFESPYPELDALKPNEIAPKIRELLNELRTMLPDGEDIRPRQTYWDREHRAFARSRDGVPNPEYKPNPHKAPLADDSGVSGTDCFNSDAHDSHSWRIEGDEYWCPGHWGE